MYLLKLKLKRLIPVFTYYLSVVTEVPGFIKRVTITGEFFTVKTDIKIAAGIP